MTYYVVSREYVGPTSVTTDEKSCILIFDEYQRSWTINDFSYIALAESDSLEDARSIAREHAKNFVNDNPGCRTMYVSDADRFGAIEGFWCGEHDTVADCDVADTLAYHTINTVLFGKNTIDQARVVSHGEDSGSTLFTNRQLCDWIVEQAEATDGDIDVLADELPEEWKEQAETIMMLSRY